MDIYCQSQNYYFTIEVDGVERELQLPRDSGHHTIYLARGLSRGLHNFKVRRQNEGSREYILDVNLNGVIGPRPENKELLIDFIGDSITAGEGNLALKPATMDGRHQDGTKTYAIRTAEALGADYFVMAKGGYYLSAGDKNISDKYTKCAYTEDKEYDFSRKADIMVINLGTNDTAHAPGATVADKKAHFKERLLSFIELIREKNGEDVKIVFAYGMMTDQFPHEVYTEVASLSDTDNLYYCHLPQNTKGAYDHPYMDGHIEAAEVLTEFLKTEVIK